MSMHFQPSPLAGLSLQSEADRLIALYGQGHLAEVAARSEALIARHPHSDVLYNILGAACIGLDDFIRAEAAFTAAAAIDPGDAEIHNNHGIALSALGRLDDAVGAFERALRLRPRYPEALYNLGNAHKKRQALEAAIAAYRQAVALKPDYAAAHNNLGLALHDLGAFEEAGACYGRALAIQPGFGEALYNLGNLLMAMKNFDGAIKAFRLALAISPERSEARAQQLHAQAHICDFSVYDEYHALRDTELRPGLVSPFSMLVFEDDPERALAYSQAWPGKAGEATLSSPPAAVRSPDDRIRIGYFSADFHSHATLCLMAGLFREHDRKRFEIIAYSYGPDSDDAMRAELVGNVDRFVDIRELPDADVAELVRGHVLDIAVDLKGYTQHSRSRLFVHRLAPLQVNYLGYPGSMGAGFIDYLFADATIVPPGDERFYSEKIVRLPGSYQPNDDRRAIIESKATRAELGLPEHGFVFCCFNYTYKISPAEFDIWMRLLAKVEGSVLWLLRSNEWAEANLKREAAARGVDPARLVFAATLPHGEHLGRLRHADLFLDTFNVNAHTTGSDALWAGLPVLTKAGRQFAARVCASLVTAVGLPELVVENEADYEARALALATEPGLLADMRDRLAAHRLTHPLFDTTGYTRQLEAAFAAIHQRRLEGLPPEHLTLG